MAWDNEMVILLRYMVDDFSQPQRYADDTLQQLILGSVTLVSGEGLVFSSTYTTSINDYTLEPDPTDVDGRDDSFISLVLTKAACIIDSAEARKASGRAVAMRDAGKSIDLNGIASAKLQIWQKGWCANYKEIKYQYLTGNTDAGIAVLGPFRLEMNACGGSWSPDGYGTPYGGTIGIYGGGRYR